MSQQLVMVSVIQHEPGTDEVVYQSVSMSNQLIVLSVIQHGPGTDDGVSQSV